MIGADREPGAAITAIRRAAMTLRCSVIAVGCAGLVGCARPPDPRDPGGPSWIERDARSELHATAPARGGADRSSESGARRPGQPVRSDQPVTPEAIDDHDEPAIRAALDALGDRAPAGKLALRAARLAHHRGDDDDARAWLDRAATAADRAEIAAAIAALGRELATRVVDPALIAVLLPLSGNFAGLGSELRAAIELAPAGGTRWLYLDTKGTPDGASAAVEAAVGRGAVGALGPVGQREALAAARSAALHGLPIALLAPGDGAEPSAGVFRAVSSVGDEARAVARLAAEDSFPTVAVLAPRDDAGRDAADAFVAEAARLGLQVTAQGSYDPTGGDVEADVRRFLGLVPAENPAFAAHLARHGRSGWTTFSPEIPYSLLYLPDRYDRAAIVASFLPYYNVELRSTDYPDPARLARKHGGHAPQVVQLVGGAGWHHPGLVVRGGPAVQGALIVDDFASELGGDAAVQFAEAFSQRMHRAPSSAAAQAYDAAALIAAARAQAAGTARAAAAGDPGRPRAALTAALAHASIRDGACGETAIGRDGEIARTPGVLEVRGDELIAAP
jgi:ABC-type branched-subunit amino acid transport system substrate-binding protein